MSFKQIIADPEGDLVLILRPNTADEIRILASSKHMTLVSPFFKALPQSNFKEGTELREKGRVEIPLPEEDSEAMTTLTYIIHSQFSKVPLALDLNEMTNIALMVDKYDMPVVVKKLFSDLWMDKCKEKVVKRWMSDEPTAKIPSTLCDDLHKWLFVSWIFERKAEFEETTKELILNSVHDNVCSVALPIPSSIYEAVQNKQIEAMTQLYAVILLEANPCKESREAYFSIDDPEYVYEEPEYLSNIPEPPPNHLFIDLVMKRGFYPTPDLPYRGASVASLRSLLKAEEPESCKQGQCPPFVNSCQTRYSIALGVFESVVEQVRNNVGGGFRLEEFAGLRS